MPGLTHKTAIRAILRRGPVWGVYALGGLAPRMFPKTQWFGLDLLLVLLGSAVTHAVLNVVKDRGTVGLNVKASNQAALRLLESLGFVRHCPFDEGLATVRR